MTKYQLAPEPWLKFSMTFNATAVFYDALYSNKNYNLEVSLINRIIEESTREKCSILDVGCGTGNHSILLAKNPTYKILGIDRSPEMVNIADSKSSHIPNLEYEVKDMLSIDNLYQKFDIVLALFHVVNYLRDDSELALFFSKVSKILNPDGKFIFDTWNGLLCSDKNFKVKTLNFEFQNETWQRISTPKLHKQLQKVTIDYSYMKNNIQFYKESHTISYWTVKQISEISNFHFIETHNYESLEGTPFDEFKHWSPLFVMSKKWSFF